jgi:hypothetical protein
MSFIQIFTLFHMNPPLNPHHFEKYTLLVFHNITLQFSHPDKKKAKIMWFDKKKIPINKIFK